MRPEHLLWSPATWVQEGHMIPPDRTLGALHWAMVTSHVSRGTSLRLKPFNPRGLHHEQTQSPHQLFGKLSMPDHAPQQEPMERSFAIFATLRPQREAVVLFWTDQHGTQGCKPSYSPLVFQNGIYWQIELLFFAVVVLNLLVHWWFIVQSSLSLIG